MNLKSHLWIMLISLAIGIACVLLNKIAPATIVIILGAAFIASGALNVAALFSSKNKEDNEKYYPSFSSFITSVGAVILGIWLIIAPEDNVTLITRILSIIVILASGYLLFSMLVYFRNARLHIGLYILPSAILAVGIWMLISPLTFTSFLVLLIGIILIVYAIATGMALLGISAFERRLKKSASEAADSSAAGIDDIDYATVNEWDQDSSESATKN